MHNSLYILDAWWQYLINRRCLMSARELLQGFKNKIEVDSHLNESEVTVTPLTCESKEKCELTVLVPIDGSIKLLRVTVNEIGTYEGLSQQ